MDGIRVEVHEPANVLSTMLLALAGKPEGAKLHPIAEKALEHAKPFRDHASVRWLGEFYEPKALAGLYGHVAQLAGPVSFVPRAQQVPAYLAAFQPERMKELPAKMATFYGDARLGTFERAHLPDYTLALTDVKDAITGARIENLLAHLFGRMPHRLVAVPVPTHPGFDDGIGAFAEGGAYAFLYPPRVAADSPDTVTWVSDPEATQVLVLHELCHALLHATMPKHPDLVKRLEPTLAAIPGDAPFAQSYADADSRFQELFIHGATVAYLRTTRGDEAARRWVDEKAAKLGTPLVHSFFGAIERHLEGRTWKDLDAFLDDLPNAIRA